MLSVIVFMIIINKFNNFYYTYSAMSRLRMYVFGYESINTVVCTRCGSRWRVQGALLLTSGCSKKMASAPNVLGSENALFYSQRLKLIGDTWARIFIVPASIPHEWSAFLTTNSLHLCNICLHVDDYAIIIMFRVIGLRRSTKN